MEREVSNPLTEQLGQDVSAEVQKARSGVMGQASFPQAIRAFLGMLASTGIQYGDHAILPAPFQPGHTRLVDLGLEIDLGAPFSTHILIGSPWDPATIGTRDRQEQAVEKTASIATRAQTALPPPTFILRGLFCSP